MSITAEDQARNRAAAKHGRQAYERYKHLPHIAHNIRMRELHEYLCIGLCRGVCNELMSKYTGRSAMNARVTVWMIMERVV